MNEVHRFYIDGEAQLREDVKTAPKKHTRKSRKKPAPLVATDDKVKTYVSVQRVDPELKDRVCMAASMLRGVSRWQDKSTKVEMRFTVLQ